MIDANNNTNIPKKKNGIDNASTASCIDFNKTSVPLKCFINLKTRVHLANFINFKNNSSGGPYFGKP